jgi:site-specific DNA-cytosine methylase
MKKLKVLGISCGNGVMIHPFKKDLAANIETRSDYNTPEQIQWFLNFPKIPLYTKSNFKDIGKINIILSHPTCGYSSNLAYSRGKKLGNGKKDDTLKLFIKSVKIKKPKIFLFENLPTLFKSFPEGEFDNKFKGYHLIKYIVPMSAFGNSQISRVRLVIVGIKKKYQRAYSSYFNLPDKQNIVLKKVFELEQGLAYPNETLCHIREDDDTIVCMEKDFKKLTLKEIRKEWNSKKYTNRKKWDATTTGKGKMKNLPGVYRNLSHGYPLTARKQNRQFNSKGDIMSPRELARIQGIPDSFNLWYDKNQHQYSINKARVTATKCPPYDLGLWFYKCLTKLIKDAKISKS